MGDAGLAAESVWSYLCNAAFWPLRLVAPDLLPHFVIGCQEPVTLSRHEMPGRQSAYWHRWVDNRDFWQGLPDMFCAVRLSRSYSALAGLG